MFENLSSYELTKNEKLVLGFGINFSIALGTLNPLSVAESFVHLEKNMRENVSQSDLQIAKGCVYGYAKKRFSCNLPRRFLTALKDLKANVNIHITKADKTNSIVILDKDAYLEKVFQLLDDETTYSKLTSDPTERINKNFNSKVKALLKHNPDILRLVFTINPTLPYMYGLVKTHKPEKPLRPIISFVASVTYKLSKWLTAKLSPLVGTISNSFIKNSSDLVNKLRTHHGNYKLISFDVNSLFTKVPVPDLLDFLKDKISRLDLPVNPDVFIQLLELCVLDNCFKVNGLFYKQTFGFAMGNPLSPVLSNIYMEFFEVHILPTICDFEIIWYRYVDDVICLWPSDRDPMLFLQELNDLVPSIKFKIEIENNNALPFLDTLVTRTHDQQLKFKVYRKPTAVESYVHYFSNHDVSIKRSVFISMFLRALRICDPEYHDEEIEKIFEIGKRLCYPFSFLEDCYVKTKRRFYNNIERNKFQYQNVLTLPFRRELKPLVNLLKELNINIIFKYSDTIKNMIIRNSPRETNHGGVYYVPCKECNSGYIGQTGKLLDQRLKQHKYNIRTANESSALFRHQQAFNHNIRWEKAEIVFKCNRQLERLLVETCLIKTCTNFNLNDGLYKLDNILIHFIQSHPRVKRAILICDNG